MNRIITIIFTLFSYFYFAQNVTLNKAEKTYDSKDQFLYYIKKADTSSVYLGELEVQGISDDADIFNQIYKKAKIIGANSYSLKPIESIDGGLVKFNPSHYYINLYYTASLPKYENRVTVISSAAKPINLKINERRITLPPRSYYQFYLKQNQKNSIVAGQFLGSKINLAYKDGQDELYFQILPAGLRADTQGTGTLSIKSGDIIKLEKSYALFLTMIYNQVER